VSDFELVRLAFHEVDATPGFADWLRAERCSVGFTCGPRLFFAGVRADGSLEVTDHQYGPCTALTAVGPDTLFLATRFQIWRLENSLLAGALTDDGHDRLFLPQAAWTTGYLAVRDMAVDSAGGLLFVNGRFSCLSTVDERLNFVPLWAPPFVTGLTPEDRCHLTGVAMDGDRAAYVTCGGPSDAPQGWKEHERDGGIVVDVATGEVVCAGLSVPHSPRLWDGRLWLTNGGTGELGTVDIERGAFEPVVSVPGFARGLDFQGRFAVVGSSRPPRDETFDGLVLDERLRRAGAESACGLFVVDLDAGAVAHSLVLHAGPPEVLDVAVLPATRSPVAVAVQGDDVQELVTIPCLDKDQELPSGV